MGTIEVDLRTQPKGCTGHPLVRLKNILKDLNEEDKVKVTTDENIIPLTAIRLIAKKAGFEVKVISEKPPHYELILEKSKAQ